MERTIIALWGEARRGKTETINRVFDLLLQNGGTLDWRNDRNRREIEAIVKIDDVKVGIISYGDEARKLGRLLRDLIAKGCVVIVCATRAPQSPTWDLLDQYSPEFPIERIRSVDQPVARRDERNRQNAALIVERVGEAVVNAQLVAS
jgi:hypothetical protein